LVRERRLRTIERSVPYPVAINQVDPPALSAMPAVYWMAEARVAGELTGFVQASDGTPRGYAEATLFVRVECRRQGIGTRLLDAAAQWAMLRNATALRLVCARTDWPMRHFAERRELASTWRLARSLPTSRSGGLSLEQHHPIVCLFAAGDAASRHQTHPR
jgi:GNAT superfamily N-acetyltransferase